MEGIFPWLLVAVFVAAVIYLATRKKNRNGSAGGGSVNHPPKTNTD